MPSVPCDRYPGTRFLVPDDRPALLVRNSLPERILPPGHHLLPPGRVEVRLLAAVPPGGEPGPEAMRLPFVRSLLYLDRELVGILVPGATGAPLTAWEGSCPRPAPWSHGWGWRCRTSAPWSKNCVDHGCTGFARMGKMENDV